MVRHPASRALIQREKSRMFAAKPFDRGPIRDQVLRTKECGSLDKLLTGGTTRVSQGRSAAGICCYSSQLWIRASYREKHWRTQGNTKILKSSSETPLAFLARIGTY